MGYSAWVIKRMLAYVPKKGRKTYLCTLCGAKGRREEMMLHLTDAHNKKIESGGYVIYEAEDK